MFKKKPASKKSIVARTLVNGVGVNDADYCTATIINGKWYKCPIYDRWCGLLKRCYSKILHKKRPTYKDCSVCNEWLTFSNFKKWMEKQDWQGKHLDKDLLVKGNKIYSPDTCIFVSAQINTLILDQENRRGKHPVGVSFHKQSGKYQASCDQYGKQKYLGLFDTPEKASQAYRNFKSKHIHEIANTQPEPLKSALIRFADYLT